ncbi:hypothetical protein FQF04_19485 [Escherichia coli]|nr:hypothetical protein [Escherichia coli]
MLAYLLKHDSNYGPFPWSVDFTEDSLIVDGKSIAVYAEKEAKNIPWKAKGAEIIVECTGFYTSAEKSQAHILAPSHWWMARVVKIYVLHAQRQKISFPTLRGRQKPLVW